MARPKKPAVIKSVKNNKTPFMSPYSLKAQFGVDVDAKENGKWVVVNEFIKIKLRSTSSKEYIKKAVKIRTELSFDNVKTTDENYADKLEEMIRRCLAFAQLTDWSGVKDDNGEDIPFTPEVAYNIICDPEYTGFADRIWELAQDEERYFLRNKESAEKN